MYLQVSKISSLGLFLKHILSGIFSITSFQICLIRLFEKNSCLLLEVLFSNIPLNIILYSASKSVMQCSEVSIPLVGQTSNAMHHTSLSEGEVIPRCSIMNVLVQENSLLFSQWYMPLANPLFSKWQNTKSLNPLSTGLNP